MSMTNRRGRSVLAIGLCVVAMAIVTAGCGSSSSTSSAGGALKLKIGFSGDFSGPVAPYDVPVLNGMKMAAKEINAKGGLNGVTVDVLGEDNKSNQAGAVQAAQDGADGAAGEGLKFHLHPARAVQQRALEVSGQIL